MNTNQRTLHSEEYNYRAVSEKSLLHKRTPDKDAAFFIPHIKPPMQLLDCGCGPGTITLGLAQRVYPGMVYGVDLDSDALETAKHNASEQGITNIRFIAENIYNLAFHDNTFDAVFSNAVLYHLKDCEAAIAEMYRVLKPGGIIGVRNSYRPADLLFPINQLLQKGHEILTKIMVMRGSNPSFGKTQANLLRAAGFVSLTPSASYDCFSTAQDIEHYLQLFNAMLSDEFVARIIGENHATREEIEAIRSAFEAWSKNETAFAAVSRCETLAMKPL